MTKQVPLSHEIQTDRFTLSFPTVEDIPFVFSATQYKGFNDGMTWSSPKSENELFEVLKRNKENWKSGTDYDFTIREKHSLKPQGRISIHKTVIENCWRVGYWVHPKFQNRGVASEALDGMLTFSFSDLELAALQSAYAVWNKASERVLLKSGFKVVDYTPTGFQKNGIWVPELKVKLNREEWIQRNA